MTLTISQATEDDVDLLYDLTVALAAYEKKTPDQILVTKEKLRKFAFGANARFQAQIARSGEKPAGMSVYYIGYSGYMGSPILYVEDLFVLPDFRGRGIATEMMRKLAEVALETECCRMQGAVFDWNADARAFYAAGGAQLRPDLIQVRLDADKLRAFVKIGAKSGTGSGTG